MRDRRRDEAIGEHPQDRDHEEGDDQLDDPAENSAEATSVCAGACSVGLVSPWPSGPLSRVPTLLQRPKAEPLLAAVQQGIYIGFT